MKVLLRLVDGLIYTYLFTAFCALILIMSTEKIISNKQPHLLNYLHFFIFGSTLVIYNFHQVSRWFFIKKGINFHWKQFLPFRLFFLLIGFILLSISIFRLPTAVIAASIFMGILSLAYSIPILPNKKRVRDYGWLKIVVLSVVWTVSIIVIPILYYQISITSYLYEIISFFVFIAINCLMFDIRDINTDKKYNIETIPYLIGIKNSYQLIAVFLLLFILFSFIKFHNTNNLKLFTGQIILCILTQIVVNFLKNNKNEKKFFIFADGLLLIYALIILLLS